MISLSPSPSLRPASASPIDFRFSAEVYMLSSRCVIITKRSDSNKGSRESCRDHDVRCLASKRGGFGPESTDNGKRNNTKTSKETPYAASRSSKLVSRGPKSRTQQGPEFSSVIVRKPSDIVLDRDFLEKVEAVKRSALEQKKSEQVKDNESIDYDAPIKSEQNTVGLGTKVGVGIAVVIFGLIFALGDFLPSGSVDPTPSEDASKVQVKKLTEKEKLTLQSILQQYEEALSESSKDATALEGAAVALVELGEYGRASSLLEKLIMERPTYVDAYRLLGEVKYELKDYEGSASAYRQSLSVSDNIDFEVLRGLTNSLLASNKPMEAVQVLLSYREHSNDGNTNGPDVLMDSDSNGDKKQVDPIQVELLLGKAYSDWGHVSDAVAVYDQLISNHPNDFRGYLAKGIILKENGKVGDAERMFIQARFFAPNKAKALVDQYSRR